MPRHIDYYFSLQSPWAYIGHRLFRDIAASHGAAVAVKPVMLLDLFAETGGLPLARR
ncbi:MAG: 2-hydroxychromene-2-carboxylate isomerase, partial [Bradyrhizobium sp.]|nr:2-hydroxychromene-2-carboxylate isomerase [Bradyrhizobium sp.]